MGCNKSELESSDTNKHTNLSSNNNPVTTNIIIIEGRTTLHLKVDGLPASWSSCDVKLVFPCSDLRAEIERRKELSFGFLRLSNIQKCPHMLRSEHRELSKVNVDDGGGGGCRGQTPILLQMDLELCKSLLIIYLRVNS